MEVAGEVLEVLPNRLFKVAIEGKKELLCHVGSPLKMHLVKLLPGDKVMVKPSPYDDKRGRIAAVL